ncbi:hypothetical protein L1887_51845 [Cichorium endivia]|nr:hypothetical protein L1887_51845 [Cichorium endivia]
MSAPTTMKAVVIQGPEKVAVVERPIPTPGPGEVVVKVSLAALCGSDLHIYRGHQPVPHYDFVLGHEFVGSVHTIGEGIKNWKQGDKVVSPFTVSCGDCFFCNRGQTGRCTQSRVFGSVPLDGAQAEYVLVPLADTTLYPIPADVPDEIMLLTADIFPTGYFVANNAYTMLNDAERKDSVAVVIGCGPVGLCAVTAACSFFKTVYAIDSVPERLAEAKKARRHPASPHQRRLRPGAQGRHRGSRSRCGARGGGCRGCAQARRQDRAQLWRGVVVRYPHARRHARGARSVQQESAIPVRPLPRARRL